MNWHILLRSIFLSIPRFFVTTVLMTLYAWIDWSPLPERAALLVLTAITHFAIAYIFVRWAFGKYRPHWKEAVMTFFIYFVVQVCCEAWYQAIRTNGSFWNLVTAYNWWSLIPITVYVLATWLAFERSHSKYQPESGDGMTIS